MHSQCCVKQRVRSLGQKRRRWCCRPFRPTIWTQLRALRDILQRGVTKRGCKKNIVDSLRYVNEGHNRWQCPFNIPFQVLTHINGLSRLQLQSLTDATNAVMHAFRQFSLGPWWVVNHGSQMLFFWQQHIAHPYAPDPQLARAIVQHHAKHSEYFNGYWSLTPSNRTYYLPIICLLSIICREKLQGIMLVDVTPCRGLKMRRCSLFGKESTEQNILLQHADTQTFSQSSVREARALGSDFDGPYGWGSLSGVRVPMEGYARQLGCL